MKNSTTQLLRSKSIQLNDVSPRSNYRDEALENKNFINHDYNNLYRSSYGDMSNKVNFFGLLFSILFKLPNLMNKHYVPKYQGFVPRMDVENIVGKTVQKNQKEQIKIFDWKRFDKMDAQNPRSTRTVKIKKK